MAEFNYETAFSRTLGWITPEEQVRLRNSRVAIAGMGGGGGAYATIMARLGVGKFSVSDFDEFDVHNFNRQAGAAMSTVGKAKVEVVADIVRDINPEADVRQFPTGVTLENVDDFLDGADVYLDGLDIYALEIRRAIFNACQEKGIPVVTAAPLGMGASWLVFKPGGVSFDEYFGLNDKQPLEEQVLRFLVGISPFFSSRKYLVYRDGFNIGENRAPSTPMGIYLIAGIAATQAMKLMLNRGGIKYAPWALHFDAYTCKFSKTWRPGGAKNPLTMASVALIQHISNKIKRETAPREHVETMPVYTVNGPQVQNG